MSGRPVISYDVFVPRLEHTAGRSSTWSHTVGKARRNYKILLRHPKRALSDAPAAMLPAVVAANRLRTIPFFFFSSNFTAQFRVSWLSNILIVRKIHLLSFVNSKNAIASVSLLDFNSVEVKTAYKVFSQIYNLCEIKISLHSNRKSFKHDFEMKMWRLNDNYDNWNI